MDRKITKEMNMTDAIEALPKTRDIMIKHGMKFIGRGFGPMESIEVIAKENGFKDEDIEKILNEINGHHEDFSMVLTKNAADKLREILEKKEMEAVRLRLSTDGVSHIYDMDFSKIKTEQDIETHSNGVKFFVDKGMTGLLKGTTIDYDTEEDGFVFSNPNIKK